MATLAGKLIKGSFLRVLNLLVTITVSFFMMPFVIRSIGDRWYGLWILVGTLVGYYGFFEFGLSTAIQRFVARALATDDHEDINRIFNTSLAFFLAGAVVSILASIAVALLGSRFIDNAADIRVFRIVILIVGLSVSISFPVRTFIGVLYATVRHDITMSIEIGKILLRTGLIVFFLLRGYGIIALAFITLFSDTASYLAIIAFTRKNYPFITCNLRLFSRGTFRQLVNYSFFSFVSNIANHLRFHIDSFVITGYLGLSMVTHYNVGSRIAGYYIMAVISATALIMPVFSTFEGERDFDKLRDKFLFVSKLNVILSIFLGGAILIYGRAFIERWMGPDYLDAHPVLVILTAGLIFGTIQTTSASLIFSLSKHKPYSIMHLCEGLANLGLSLLLVKRYGINGVALGTAIPVIIFYAFIVPVYAVRVIDLPITRYIRAMTPSFVIGSATLFGCWLAARSFIAAGYPRLFLLGACTFVIYVAVSVFVLLSREERRYFKIPV
jgi:O-antigen/teichoic acid export membrane protein